MIYSIQGMEEPSGLAIKSELEKYRDEEINHGRLYPNLDQLVEKGFVEKSAKDRRTNLYTLTG
jgi:DNA-binding PadR family transcriptional regulator